MEHYALFVNSMYTLSKELITQVELDKFEEDLMRLVAQFELLYGTEAMTFNVHNLLHLVENGRRSGPLWATSAVAFERNIYLLKRTLHGPKGPEQQMSINMLQRLSYMYEPRPLTVPDEINLFCESVFNKKRFTACAITANNITFFAERKIAADKALGSKFYRCAYREQIYSSVRYTRSKKIDDTMIELKTGEIGQINKICLRKDGICYLEIQKFIAEPIFIGSHAIFDLWKIKSKADYATIFMSDVKSKMVKLNLPRKNYVCNMPNTIELQ